MLYFLCITFKIMYQQASITSIMYMIISKANQVNAFLHRTFTSVPVVLCACYKSMVRPIVKYSSSLRLLLVLPNLKKLFREKLPDFF